MELIKEARDWADAALPPEPWRFGHVSVRLADALEAAEAERVHRIWYPLFDTPITVSMSREQMQALADELRGVNVFPGWAEQFAQNIDAVLKEATK